MSTHHNTSTASADIQPNVMYEVIPLTNDNSLFGIAKYVNGEQESLMASIYDHEHHAKRTCDYMNMQLNIVPPPFSPLWD